MAGVRHSYAGYYEVVMNGEIMVITRKILRGLKRGAFVILPSQPLNKGG